MEFIRKDFRLHTRLDIYIFKCVLRSERVSCNVFCFSLFAGQIKRSMYAFSPVECLDCTSNLTAAGLGWLVKVLWFACDTAVCVHVDLLNFVPLGLVGNQLPLKFYVTLLLTDFY